MKSHKRKQAARKAAKRPTLLSGIRGINSLRSAVKRLGK